MYAIYDDASEEFYAPDCIYAVNGFSPVSNNSREYPTVMEAQGVIDYNVGALEGRDLEVVRV